MGRESERGFTLMELMIVIAIIAVIAAIAIPNILAAKLASNETAAIATLRALVSAQAQVQGTGRIDVDNDSVGEHATFIEMTGEAGVRKTLVPPNGARSAGATFQSMGTPIAPPALSPSLVDGLQDRGELVKGGYGFTIYLPDTGRTSRWVHENVRIRSRGRGRRARTVEIVSLKNDSGGPGQVGVDLSESLWCAYARPVRRGSSGNRAFFTHQLGDILQSGNDAAKQEVSETMMAGSEAYLGAGITSAVAVGTAGNDGEVWKLTN